MSDPGGNEPSLLTRVADDVSEVKKHLTGNGKPHNGLLWRVHALEETDRARNEYDEKRDALIIKVVFGSVTAAISAVAAAAIAAFL